MGALIRKVVKVAPPRWLTFILIFVGVVSSVATDAGYLILVPLAAAAFMSVGRHPLAGLAAAFARVGAVFGVNLLLTPSDAMLNEVTNSVLKQLNMPQLKIPQNYFFSIASSFAMAAVVWFVTVRITQTRLGVFEGEDGGFHADEEVDAAAEAKGLRTAGIWVLIFLAFVLLITLPPGAPLRDPETGNVIGNTPFMASLVFVISLAFMVAGLGYGRGGEDPTGRR